MPILKFEMNRFILESGSLSSTSTGLDSSTWECIHCTFQNSTAEYPDACELCNIVRQSKPLTTVKLCPVCTYGNSLDAFKCLMCEQFFQEDEKKENLCFNTNNCNNSYQSSVLHNDPDFSSASKKPTTVLLPVKKSSTKLLLALDFSETALQEKPVVEKETSMESRSVSRNVKLRGLLEEEDNSEDELQNTDENEEMSDFDEDEDCSYSDGDSYSQEEEGEQNTDDDEEAFIDSDDNVKGKHSLLRVRKEKVAATKKEKNDVDEIEEYESDYSESCFFDDSPKGKRSDRKSSISDEPRGELKPSFPQVSEHFW
jgi:hypothetical protein